MRVSAPKGDYLRMAEETDVRFIFDCTRDWPNGAWSYDVCSKLVSSSLTNAVDLPDGSAQVPTATVIYCLDGDEETRVGFCNFAYLNPGPASGVDFISLAVHPDLRGESLYRSDQGRYYDFERILGYYVNQYLRAAGARFGVIDTATSIERRSNSRRAKTQGIQKREGMQDKRMFSFSQSDYEAQAFSRDRDREGFEVR